MTKTKKKIAKRGPAKWLSQDLTVLQQMDKEAALAAEASYKLQARDIKKRKDLTEEE